MEKHRSDARRGVKGKGKLYQIMNDLGIENFYIELIEHHSCNTKEELFKKEGEWIRKMGTLNGQIQGRTPEQYRTDTVVQKQEYDKEYNKNNKDKITEKQKQNIKTIKNTINKKAMITITKRKKQLEKK